MQKRKIKELRPFLADLANLLLYSIEVDSTPASEDDIEHLASLLLLSAGIRRVEFNRSEFDPNFGWCSDADRFQGYQDQLEQRIVDSLTRFQFIWSSIEAAINFLIPKKLPATPPGKVNKLCSFLKTEFEPRAVSTEYKDRLHELNTLAVADSYYANSLMRRQADAHIGISGYGVASVYSIRNSLAHGSLGVPISMQEEEEFLDVQLINCCSSIVAHSLQMLLTAFFAKHLETVNWEHDDVDFETLMRVFHLNVSLHESDKIGRDLFITEQ